MVNYSEKGFSKEHMARAMGRTLPISFKQTIEVCNFIRGKNISSAKDKLMKVTEKKLVVPFKRFNGDVGHKKKVGPGRFPVKVSNEIIKLLDAVEANAQFKGLNTSNLIIKHICAHKGGKAWHYGRKRGRQMKRTTVELIVEEKSKKEDKKEPKKELKEPKKDVQEKKEVPRVSENAKENKQGEKKPVDNNSTKEEKK